MNGKKSPAEELSKAHACIGRGKIEEAREILESIRQEIPVTDPVLHCRAGELYSSLGEHALAAEHFAAAAAAKPQCAMYLNRLASTYLSLNELQQAERLLMQSQEIDPEDAEALALLGSLCLMAGEQCDKAIGYLERALPKKPHDVLLHMNLAIALNRVGLHDQAMEHALLAKRLGSKNPQAYNVIGMIQLQVGQSAEAIANFEKAIAINPKFHVAYFNLSTAKKFRDSDKPFINRVIELSRESMAAPEKTSLCFALGKMLDDIGDHENAFFYFRQGNLLSKRPLTSTTLPSLIARQKKICTRKYLHEHSAAGNSSEVPVFIVGMPRSGTTLIEQIIASHPQAAGAGELTYLREISEKIFHSSPGVFFRYSNNRETVDQLAAESAAEYLNKLQTGHEAAMRITDKMPTNYMFLGTIALLFPKAKIIHAVRHPLDTCLSCYFQPFKDQQWSFDQARLAETYRNYRKLMDHWKAVLPAGMINDVQYEQLIRSPETESKALVSFCGLEWDPACLQFHDTPRQVMTASMWQVRQPIYQTSKMRWIKYAPWIGELAEGINNYLDDSDREIFLQHGIKLARKKRFDIF